MSVLLQWGLLKWLAFPYNECNRTRAMGRFFKYRHRYAPLVMFEIIYVQRNPKIQGGRVSWWMLVFAFLGA